MKVFYYYYYLFYRRILLDPDPQLAAILGITSLEGFFLVAFFGIVLAHFFCFDFNKYYMIAAFSIVLLLNIFYFFTPKKVKAIVTAKPRFSNSHHFTVAFVWFFSVSVISTLFWTGDYINIILDNCRK
jgi:hypothetical protein